MRYFKNKTAKRKEADRLLETAWEGIRAMKTLRRHHGGDINFIYQIREALDFNKPSDMIFLDTECVSLELDGAVIDLLADGTLSVGCKEMSLPKAFRVLKSVLKADKFDRVVDLGGRIGRAHIRKNDDSIVLDDDGYLSLIDARKLKKFITKHTHLK